MFISDTKERNKNMAEIEGKMLKTALELKENDVSLKTWLFLVQRSIDTQNLIFSTSLHEIANATGCNISTIKRRVNEFEKNQLIKTQRTNKGSVIEILA